METRQTHSAHHQQQADDADHQQHGGQSGHPLPAQAEMSHGPHGVAQPAGHAAEHAAHRADHTGHERLFRNRFWVCLALSVPVLLYSPMLQMWFGFTMPAFPGSRWVGPLFAGVVFLYGGAPFLQMAAPELRNRQPGMMTLISLAISVAFAYSLAALFIDPEGGFFWELVTLIDIMLLGHWMEMRSLSAFCFRPRWARCSCRSALSSWPSTPSCCAECNSGRKGITDNSKLAWRKL